MYRATDTRLKRQVAIKILPPSLAADHDRLARFQREAEVLASLNHPKIAAIYGLEESPSPSSGQAGVTALVMELVEGDDLSQLIGRRAGLQPRQGLPLDEALPIAKQIAEALEAAHEQGIIHRDLKPANIKVRPDGVVKVLDFGLAKLNVPNVSNGPNGPNVSQAPTITTPAHLRQGYGGQAMTQAGMILGTAAYMSPEQAKGREADKRSDVWAFGCVLYETLTGRRPFDGEDVSDTLANVLKVAPDWAALPADLPSVLLTLLKGCLEKARTERIADIAVARFLLNQPVVSEALLSATAGRESPRGSQVIVRGAVAALAAIIAGAGAWFAYPRLHSTPAQVTRFQIEPPENTSLTVPTADSVNGGVVSPDGTRLVFAARDASGKVLLWVRPLDAFDAQPLVGTDGAAYPFWSPDSRSIGFFAAGALKRVDAAGGPSRTICDVPATPRGGSWGSRGVVLFGTSSTPIFQVPAEGGQPTPVTRLDTARGEASHRFPSFLPDGRGFLYLALAGGDTDAKRVYVGSTDVSEATHLLDATTNATYAPPGLVLFSREGTLFRQAFDAATHELRGAAVPIAERIVGTDAVGGAYSASATGVLTFRSGANDLRQLTWFDRTGRMLETVGPPGAYRAPALSPDGTRLAFGRTDQQAAGDIWLLDLARATMSRLTFNPGPDTYPVWSPDGSTIVYTAGVASGLGYYRKNAAGTGAEEEIAKTSGLAYAAGISPDGKLLLSFGGTARVAGNDIFVRPLAGDGKPLPLVQTPFNDVEPAFSPDGHWIAYASQETGRYELYVQPFPQTGGRWQISSAGGRKPAWRGDGKELFFADEENKLYAVDVNGSGKTFEYGAPHVLFEMRTNTAASDRNSYVVSRDGQRILVNTLLAAAASPINVVVNWSAEIGR